MNSAKILIIFLLISSVFVFGCNVHIKMQVSKKMVCIGDSYTQGWSNGTFIIPYTTYLGNYIPSYTIINKGTGGDKTSYMLARFQTDVINNSPKVVIIEGGRNDIYFGVNIITAESNIDSMCRMAKQNNIVPVLTLLFYDNSFNTSQNQQITQLNNWIANYAIINNYPLIDWNTPFQDPSNPQHSLTLLISGDNIHPNAIGYQRMSTTAYNSLFNLPVTL